MQSYGIPSSHAARDAVLERALELCDRIDRLRDTDAGVPVSVRPEIEDIALKHLAADTFEEADLVRLLVLVSHQQSTIARFEYETWQRDARAAAEAEEQLSVCEAAASAATAAAAATPPSLGKWVWRGKAATVQRYLLPQRGGMPRQPRQPATAPPADLIAAHVAAGARTRVAPEEQHEPPMQRPRTSASSS